MQPSAVPTVRVDELEPDAILVDCREPEEWRAGHIEGSRHVPMNSVPTELQYRPDTFAADGPVVVVCKVGGRSAVVADWLLRNGVDAVNLDGGVLAWTAAGRPLVTPDGTPGTVA